MHPTPAGRNAPMHQTPPGPVRYYMCNHTGPTQMQLHVASHSHSPTTNQTETRIREIMMEQHNEEISQLSNSLCEHAFNINDDNEPRFVHLATLQNRYLTFYVADYVQCNGRRQISLYANYITPSYSNENRQPHTLHLFRRGGAVVDPRDDRTITFRTIRDWIKILLELHAHPLYHQVNS